MVRIEIGKFTREDLEKLNIGDEVLLSGVIYTARDAAHARLYDMMQSNTPLPIPLQSQAIYYTGPTPAPQGMPIGSCGPTTSSRMDKFTPALLDGGVAILIGKGGRAKTVMDSLVKNKAVYLAAAGGAGAYLAACVQECEAIAFLDLGTEAIHRLVVKDMPLIVAADTRGNDLYIYGREKYKKEIK